MEKRRECDTEHLRDYPDCFEECEHDECVALELKPDQSMLLTDFRATVIDHLERCGVDSDNDYHADRICEKLKVVLAKTASIKDGECKERLEEVYHDANMIGQEKADKYWEQKIEALIGEIGGMISREANWIKALKATYTSKKEKGR